MSKVNSWVAKLYIKSRVKYFEAIKLHTLSHLVGSLPFTMSTMHGHMNTKFQINLSNIDYIYRIVSLLCLILWRAVLGNLYQLRFYLTVSQGTTLAGKRTAFPVLSQTRRHTEGWREWTFNTYTVSTYMGRNQQMHNLLFNLLVIFRHYIAILRERS
jgi:hypothetical protein